MEHQSIFDREVWQRFNRWQLLLTADEAQAFWDDIAWLKNMVNGQASQDTKAMTAAEVLRLRERGQTSTPLIERRGINDGA